jgi:nitrogen fixation protein FixH
MAKVGARQKETRAAHRLGDGIMDLRTMMKLRTKDAAGDVKEHRKEGRVLIRGRNVKIKQTKN